uniref:Uncharacterized protein n=1 Tax=Arundo donax TaxID=35708 RepID=A0A0A9C397_ARUDO
MPRTFCFNSFKDSTSSRAPHFLS